MRTVTNHHTAGLDSLTDAIQITSDMPDEKNGSGVHQYRALVRDTAEGNVNEAAEVAFIQFPHGPRGVDGSTPGITSQALISILIDHFESFQQGPFKCRENARIISFLEDAKNVMIQRVIDRKRRSVLGKLEK